jgi:hypothetical protein
MCSVTVVIRIEVVSDRIAHQRLAPLQGVAVVFRGERVSRYSTNSSIVSSAVLIASMMAPSS